MLNESNDDKLAFEILNKLEYSQERESVNLTKLFDGLIRAYTGGDAVRKRNFEVDVDLSYNGLRLGELFEEGDFKAMFHDFKNKRKLHAKYAIKIFDETIRLLSELPNIPEVSLEVDDKCIIVGDLHGHFDDLLSILNRFNIPGKSCVFVFNGDWVDRGSNQIEVLLSIFYSFILYPNRVLLNRGNHEDFQQNSHLTYEPCLKQVTESYFGKYGSVVYQKIDQLFRHLPLACIINNKKQDQRFFVVHGGISRNIDLDTIRKLNRTKFATICQPDIEDSDSLEFQCVNDVQDLLWSDPYPSDEEDLEGERTNELRNIGKQFGADVTKRFLENNNFSMIIRSHECKARGYKLMHDNKLLTVFSASNYNQENEGCIVKISSDKPKLEILTYMTKTKKDRKLSSTHDTDKLTKAIRKLRTHLYKLKPFLLRDFRDSDPQSTGVITIDQLISVLNKYLPNLPFREIKDRICECDDNENKAMYESLFTCVTISSKYDTAPEFIRQNYEILRNIFEKIDVDSSGYISPNEFQSACAMALERLGITFTPEEINSFMHLMDVNHDGLIDLQEFNNAFTVTLND